MQSTLDHGSGEGNVNVMNTDWAAAGVGVLGVAGAYALLRRDTLKELENWWAGQWALAVYHTLKAVEEKRFEDALDSLDAVEIAHGRVDLCWTARMNPAPPIGEARG